MISRELRGALFALALHVLQFAVILIVAAIIAVPAALLTGIGIIGTLFTIVHAANVFILWRYDRAAAMEQPQPQQEEHLEDGL
jgi:membrane protein implicated in regulation of membrane protease activity